MSEKPEKIMLVQKVVQRKQSMEWKDVGWNLDRMLLEVWQKIFHSCNHYSSSIITYRCYDICEFNSYIKESRCLTSLHTEMNTAKMLFKLIGFNVLWWMRGKARKFAVFFLLRGTNRAFSKIITPKKTLSSPFPFVSSSSKNNLQNHLHWE